MAMRHRELEVESCRALVPCAMDLRPDVVLCPLLPRLYEAGEVHEARIVYTPGLGGSALSLLPTCARALEQITTPALNCLAYRGC